MNGNLSTPDWVAKRAQCEIDPIFEDLCMTIRRDVSRMNGLSIEKRREFIFDIKSEGNEKLLVLRFPEFAKEKNKNNTDTVTFTKTDVGIDIKYLSENGWYTLTAVPLWNDETLTCVLRFNESLYQIWEISQKALVYFFFGGFSRRVEGS